MPNIFRWLPQGRLLGIMLVIGAGNGCTAFVIDPVRQEPWDGVFTAPPAKAPASQVTGGAKQHLAVVLNTNTKATIDYLQRMQKASELNAKLSFWAPGASDIGLAFGEVHNPEFLVKWIVKVLKDKFGNVTIIRNLSDFNASQYSALAIVDIYSLDKHGFWTYEVDSSVATSFYDQQMRHIGTSKGHVKRTSSQFTEAGNKIRDMQQVSIDTLNQWEASTNTLVVMKAPATATAEAYRRCIQRAMALKGSKTRERAVALCGNDMR